MIDVLGEGGMGVVYGAFDPELDRKVAIKLLHDDRAAELGAERFLSEIRTTAKLRHPNILPLFDSGAITDRS
ncbi:MAG TPA: protein kinase, partial [Kofleriaceae bacterium]